jgi:hypothetical protein
MWQEEPAVPVMRMEGCFWLYLPACPVLVIVTCSVTRCDSSLACTLWLRSGLPLLTYAAYGWWGSCAHTGHKAGFEA